MTEKIENPHSFQMRQPRPPAPLPVLSALFRSKDDPKGLIHSHLSPFTSLEKLLPAEVPAHAVQSTTDLRILVHFRPLSFIL